MNTAYEVAQFVASKRPLNGETQMHKLMYYVQAWSLAWDGDAIFDDEIEAWKNGPVLPSLRHLTVTPKSDVPLSEQQKSNIEAVLRHYGSLSGSALGRMSHDERPWQEARKGYSVGASCSEVISHDSMRREYSAQSQQGKGPRRMLAPTGRKVADMAEVLQRSTGASKRWDRTLALLAR